MNDDLDTLLQNDLLSPPPDFTRRVMQRVKLLPQRNSLSAIPPNAQSIRWTRLRRLVTLTGLVGGGMLGLSQLAGFVFGLWIATSAL